MMLMMALLTVCQFADILAQLAIGIVAFVALHQIALVNTCSHVENLQGAEKTIAITDETTVKILTYLGRMCDGKDVSGATVEWLVDVVVLLLRASTPKCRR